MRIVILIVLGALAACTRPNPNTCCVTQAQCDELGADELRPCEAGQACQASTCVASECDTSADCTSAAAPVCILNLCASACVVDDDCAGLIGRSRCAPDGTCVGCIDSTQCTAAAPTCDAEDRGCRGCERDSECGTGVCVEADAVCVAEPGVVYLNQNGTDGECTRTAPCATLTHALTKVRANRAVIHILGGTFDMGAQPVTVTTHVVLDGTATALYNGGAGSTFIVGLTGSLTLERVSLTLANTRSFDISMGGTIRIYDTTLNVAGPQDAITASGGTFNARASTIMGPVSCDSTGQLSITDSLLQRASIWATGCLSTIARNEIIGGDRTVYILGGTSTIENNLVVINDEYADAVYVTGGSGSSVRFNTIVNMSTVMMSAVALYCDAGVSVTSNVFAYNSSNPINGGGCTAMRSVFDLAGAGDAGSNPSAAVTTLFADFGGRDFHLGSASPGRDGGEPGKVTVDLEGTPRSSSTPDIGAYEAH